MTPAINSLENQGIAFQLHEYVSDPAQPSYGLEAAQRLEVPAARVFKTLVTELGTSELAVGLVPVSGELNLKRLATALGAKKVKMADPKKVERSTGYVLGGISPLGQKRALRTVIDESARGAETIFVSGGKRGLEIELSANDLAQALGAQFALIAT